MSAAEIRTIHNDFINNTHNPGMHSHFIKTFPKLYAKITDPNSDQDMIEALIKIRSQLESNSLSQHDADIAFGKVAVDKYVKPMI